MLQQPLPVGGEPEEVILLLGPDGLARGVDRAAALDELIFLLEGLAADAVEARVAIQVEVTGSPDPLQQRLDRLPVPRLGGPDEVVMEDNALIPRGRESRPLKRSLDALFVFYILGLLALGIYALGTELHGPVIGFILIPTALYSALFVAIAIHTPAFSNKEVSRRTVR